MFVDVAFEALRKWIADNGDAAHAFYESTEDWVDGGVGHARDFGQDACGRQRGQADGAKGGRTSQVSS